MPKQLDFCFNNMNGGTVLVNKSKIKKVLQIEIPHWRDSLLRASETLALKSKKST